MINSNEYIFFEADQVLTNDHLNESFNYLDNQARLTRNKLIGIGIACGLEVAIHAASIQITKGCGVTSQGYLIVQPEAQYTYYIPYTAIAIPKDMPFKHTADLPFYEGYDTGKQIFLMLTNKDYNALEKAKQKTAVAIDTTNTFFEDYAVALFLEMSETALKNCDMQDCNNEGEQILFTIRPLLVPIAGLLSVKNGAPDKINLTYEPHSIHLKRYNVPYKPIIDTEEVLKAFYDIVDNKLLEEITAALTFCYEEFGYLVKITTNPFTGLLADLKKIRDHIYKLKPVFIEYFYDFMDDLIKAYYELSAKATGISVCCPDADLFPLHLILGSASESTSVFAKDPYRDYFIYSGLFSKMEGDAAEATLLFKRIIVMLEEFAVQTQAVIKITPSQYEWPPLSARAIPYYYYGLEAFRQPVDSGRLEGITALKTKSKGGTELYKYWNYNKTIKKEETFNLSYNSPSYTSNKAVTEPLLYDIEHYNFFRIEGHIGENYKKVLSNILEQRLEYNLPFDVVAVSAEQLHLANPLPACNMQDLETAYQLILGDATCKIHTFFCYITHQPFTFDVGDVDGARPTDGGTSVYTGVDIGDETFAEYKIQGALDFTPYISVNTTYKRGDFLRKNCKPAAGTLGYVYLNSLSDKGVFTNPALTSAKANKLLLPEYHLLQYIEAVEELMLVLHSHTLAEINIEQLVLEYRKFLEITILVIEQLIKTEELSTDGTTTTPGEGTNPSYVTFAAERELGALTDELGLLLSMCIDERVDVLKREYITRLNNYNQQLAFFNYYKKHPGLEHKAGVPKGGTFVLVYHTDIRSLYEPVNAVGGSVWTKPTTVLTHVSADETVVAQPSPYSKELTALIVKFVDECTDGSPSTKHKIITSLNPPAVITTRGIPDGSVIADFYIPYLCCSDCPPVAYIMPEPRKPTKPTQPPPAQPTIDPAGPFCLGATKGVQLTGSPTGGTFGDSEGNPITGLNPDGTFNADLLAGTYEVSYTVSGVSSATTEIVIDSAISTFTVTSAVPINVQVPIEGLIVQFTADQANGAAVIYNWQLDPASVALYPIESPTNEQMFQVTFNFSAAGAIPGPINITLTVGNGPCKSATNTAFSFAFNPDTNQYTINPA